MNTETDPRRTVVNRFKADCANCGRTVAPEAGTQTRGGGLPWITQHNDCAAAAAPVATPTPARRAGWSDAAKRRRGYTGTGTCRFCGGFVRGGGCTVCDEAHETY